MRATAELDRAGARVARPTSVPPPDRFSVPLWTFTVPLLLNVVEIVEVAALPLLVKVPRLFTTAVAAGVGATRDWW